MATTAKSSKIGYSLHNSALKITQPTDINIYFIVWQDEATIYTCKVPQLDYQEEFLHPLLSSSTSYVFTQKLQFKPLQ